MNKPIYILLQNASDPPMAKENPEEPRTNESIYCKALAETLHHVDLPVTVGFYAPRGRNKKRFLDEVEDHMCQRGKQNQDGYNGARNVCSLLLFMWHIIFQLPVSSSIKPENIRYIFINFDAWEYVGCDYTWAGLVTTLLDEIEGNYIIPFSLFRAFGADFKEEPGPQEKKWVFKGWSKIFFLCVSCLFLGLTLCAVMLRESVESKLWERMSYTMIATFSLFSFPFVCGIKNVLFTQKRRIQKEFKRKDLTAELGFMHSVKQEVETITKFLQFMAFKEERQIRVVLKITNLDLCAPDKVVAVLDAVSILLSDKDAPFMSILAADSSILVECIQQSSNTWSNGYLYLDRIVSLPFSLPQMSCKAKRQLLNEILNRKKNGEKASAANQGTHPYNQNGQRVREDKCSLTTEKFQQVLQYLSHENFEDYVPGNPFQIKRVVNTVLTITSMIGLGFKPKLGLNVDRKDARLVIQDVIDWVTLASFWPCRLSWILQCEEDAQQRRKLDESQAGRSLASSRSGEGNQPGIDGKTLLAFYEDHAWELDKIKNSIRKLLELDGDPDLFRLFLQKSHFTVEGAGYFSGLLINLDFSLKRQFELLRGLSGITWRDQTEDESGGKENGN